MIGRENKTNHIAIKVNWDVWEKLFGKNAKIKFELDFESDIARVHLIIANTKI